MCQNKLCFREIEIHYNSIPISEQLFLCSAATAGLYLANLCYPPNQVRGSPSSISHIPATHILCQSLSGWKDHGKTVDLPFWTHHKWIGSASFTLLLCFKEKKKIRWPNTVFPFLFHTVQFDLLPDTEAAPSKSSWAPAAALSTPSPSAIWALMLWLFTSSKEIPQRKNYSDM